MSGPAAASFPVVVALRPRRAHREVMAAAGRRVADAAASSPSRRCPAGVHATAAADRRRDISLMTMVMGAAREGDPPTRAI